MDIIEYITKHEGLRLKPYRCPKNKWTIGVGRNFEDNPFTLEELLMLLKDGITKEAAAILLFNDLKICVADLKTIFPNWDTLTPNRKMVLIDMRFQLGSEGFRKFKITIQAVKDEDWAKVGRQIRASLYYTQVPNRAKENIKLMEEG